MLLNYVRAGVTCIATYLVSYLTTHMTNGTKWVFKTLAVQMGTFDIVPGAGGDVVA